MHVKFSGKVDHECIQKRVQIRINYLMTTHTIIPRDHSQSYKKKKKSYIIH